MASARASPESTPAGFPLVMTIFLFIIVNNWIGILPGFGTIGWVESPKKVVDHAEEKAERAGENVDRADIEAHVELQVFEGTGGLVMLPPGSVDNHISAEEYKKDEGFDKKSQTPGLLIPYLRSANTDINTPLALALIAMVAIHWWGLSTLGVFGHIGKFINFKQGPIMLIVGLLEIIGELARIVSFILQAVRQHLRGRNAAHHHGVPPAGDRTHSVPRPGAIRGIHAGHRFLGADPRVRLYGGRGHDGEHH